jgi:Holliday junction resolvase RusA-like endonuclease
VLKASAPIAPPVKPDVLKLARAVEDAMSGIIYKDDAQIVTERLCDRYGILPGVAIQVEEEVVAGVPAFAMRLLADA